MGGGDSPSLGVRRLGGYSYRTRDRRRERERGPREKCRERISSGSFFSCLLDLSKPCRNNEKSIPSSFGAKPEREEKSDNGCSSGQRAPVRGTFHVPSPRLW